MFAVSNYNNVYSILNNWCICINISCGSVITNYNNYQYYSHYYYTIMIVLIITITINMLILLLLVLSLQRTAIRRLQESLLDLTPGQSKCSVYNNNDDNTRIY